MEEHFESVQQMFEVEGHSLHASIDAAPTSSPPLPHTRSTAPAESKNIHEKDSNL